MGCNCGGGSRKEPTKKRTIIASTPKLQKPRVIIKSAGKKRPCSKCGWMLAKVRYRDIKTNGLIEKLTCANRKCTDYNM